LYNKPGRSFSLKEKLPTFQRTVRIAKMCTRMISESRFDVTFQRGFFIFDIFSRIVHVYGCACARARARVCVCVCVHSAVEPHQLYKLVSSLLDTFFISASVCVPRTSYSRTGNDEMSSFLPSGETEREMEREMQDRGETKRALSASSRWERNVADAKKREENRKTRSREEHGTPAKALFRALVGSTRLLH